MQESTGAFARATGRTGEAPSGRQVNYRRWQFEQIAPHCGPSVLEVGAGLGEFAAQLRGRERLVLTDVDPLAVYSDEFDTDTASAWTSIAVETGIERLVVWDVSGTQSGWSRLVLSGSV